MKKKITLAFEKHFSLILSKEVQHKANIVKVIALYRSTSRCNPVFVKWQTFVSVTRVTIHRRHRVVQSYSTPLPFAHKLLMSTPKSILNSNIKSITVIDFYAS